MLNADSGICSAAGELSVNFLSNGFIVAVACVLSDREIHKLANCPTGSANSAGQ
jgi:hypothetical protein